MTHKWRARGPRKLLVLASFVLTVSISLWSERCVGPAPMEARVHSHADADAYTALGIWFGSNNKSACAAQAFQAGLKIEPASPRLSYLLGLSLYTAGEVEQSVVPLQRAVALNPTSENAHLLLASAFTGVGRSKDAFVEWQAALRIDPNSQMALDGIAKVLIAAGDNESVIAQLAAAELDENLAVDLATAYGNAGQFDNAARVLDKELATHPDSVLLTSSLASVYIKQLRITDADKIAEELAHRNPSNIEAQRVYLQVLVFNAENQAALPLARKLLGQAPHDADFLYLNGVVERATGDFVGARKHLEEAARLDPNRYSTRFNLGCALEQLHDDAEAKAQLEKAIAIDPNEPESRFELAKVLRRLGEEGQAQKQLALYQKQVKEQSDRGVAAQKATEAAEALRAGDKQRAAALYREAISALPDNAGLLYQLAVVLSDLDDTQGERAALEGAIKIDRGFALAQFALGSLDSREGKNKSAEERFRQAIQGSPGYVRAWVALASTLAAESRFSEAMQAVDSALKIAPDDTQALELRKNLIAGRTQR